MAKIKKMFAVCICLMLIMLLLVGHWIWPLVSDHHSTQHGLSISIKRITDYSRIFKNGSIFPSHQYVDGLLDNQQNEAAIVKMDFKLCHFPDQLIPSSHSNNVIVIGVTSFLGYHAAITISKDKSGEVLAIENSINIPIMNNMAWMRWKSLKDSNIESKYLNLSSTKELDKVMSKHRPSTVVYVPSPLFDGFHDGDIPLEFQLNHLSDSLQSFVTLLQLVHSNYSNTRVVLFSLSRSNNSSTAADLSIQRGWLKCFEVTLSAFEGLYGLRAGVIKVDGVNGPLQSTTRLNRDCYDVSEVMKMLIYDENRNIQCIEQELKSCNKPLTYNSNGMETINTIMTTYFTGILDPQHPYYFLPDSYLLLGTYLKGSIQLGLNVVIFHNALSNEFQDRVKQYYNNIEFVKSDIKGRTPNDKRFYLFYDYLLDHPDIDRVLMTDMRDVTVLNNPFDIMEGIGDQLYVGLDLPWFVDAASQGYVYMVIKMCYGVKEAESFAAKMHPFLNAGVVGGYRNTVLSALYLVIEYLNKTREHANCNMGAINLVFHRFFGNKLLGGYPIQSGFKAQMPGPEGVGVKHKAKIGWS